MDAFKFIKASVFIYEIIKTTFLRYFKYKSPFTSFFSQKINLCYISF